MDRSVIEFFKPSAYLEYEILRPLSFIRSNWELQIDPETGRYLDEPDSFAWPLNHLVDRLATISPPLVYHDIEDVLAEHVQKNSNWNIRKKGGSWLSEAGSRLTPSDYLAALEQGGFAADGRRTLLLAASGRIYTAMRYGHEHFDDMERGHRVILGGVLATILYHWEIYEGSVRTNETEQVAAGDRLTGGA
ncbi:hypothetical protein [Salinisphaera sp. LB1]|uniref:hypothetical protein n=1 Tax=Salinisphaera sp. LB1 TaxID=2183911 RepID=UPI000FF82CED|nr:hypothetical protein [Salinisphaera sp. LB1]